MSRVILDHWRTKSSPRDRSHAMSTEKISRYGKSGCARTVLHVLALDERIIDRNNLDIWVSLSCSQDQSSDTPSSIDSWQNKLLCEARLL